MAQLAYTKKCSADAVREVTLLQPLHRDARTETHNFTHSAVYKLLFCVHECTNIFLGGVYLLFSIRSKRRVAGKGWEY